MHTSRCQLHIAECICQARSVLYQCYKCTIEMWYCIMQNACHAGCQANCRQHAHSCENILPRHASERETRGVKGKLNVSQPTDTRHVHSSLGHQRNLRHCLRKADLSIFQSMVVNWPNKQPQFALANFANRAALSAGSCHLVISGRV